MDTESSSSSIADSGFDSSYPIRPPRKKKQPDNIEKETKPVILSVAKSVRSEKKLKNFLKSLPSTAAEKIRSSFWNLVC